MSRPRGIVGGRRWPDQLPEASRGWRDAHVASSQATGFDSRSRAADDSIRSPYQRRTAVTIIGDIVPCVYREARRSACMFFALRQIGAGTCAIPQELGERYYGPLTDSGRRPIQRGVDQGRKRAVARAGRQRATPGWGEILICAARRAGQRAPHRTEGRSAELLGSVCVTAGRDHRLGHLVPSTAAQ